MSGRNPRKFADRRVYFGDCKHGRLNCRRERPSHIADPEGYWSTFTSASTIIFANFADSARRKSRNCSGVVGAGSKPSSFSLAASSGVFSACTIAPLSLRMIGSGVPDGAYMPKKLTSSKVERGLYSAIAGTSGKTDARVSDVTAIGRRRALWMNGSDAPMLANV